MAAQFPTAVPVYSNPTASMTLGSADHVALHSNVNDDVVGLATKMGKGASLPNTAGILRVTNAGTLSTGWGLIQTADIGLGQIGTQHIAGSQITTALILDGTILNADISAAAAIAYSKLALTGSIATADLAALAVTQIGSALGSSSGPTTTSASYVDMPDMSVTLTTTGGPLLCFGYTDINNTAITNAMFTALRLDAGATVFDRQIDEPAATYTCNAIQLGLFTGVAAGSHTVKTRWMTSGGTMSCITTRRALFVLELKR